MLDDACHCALMQSVLSLFGQFRDIYMQLFYYEVLFVGTTKF